MLPDHLNLDAVQAFAVFAESLNFSAAAQVLHISQPALHTKIRKLGEQLNTPLYLRHGRTLSLTGQGEAVARLGRELAARTRLFCETMQGQAHQPVVLAAGEGAYMYLLGGGIRSFLQGPEARLSLLTADRDRALQHVREGRAQLGVAPLVSVPDDLDAQLLCVVGQALAVPRRHPLAQRKSLKLKDLAGHALIVPPEGRPQRQMLASLFQSQGVEWSVAVEAGGWELMLQFVQMGIGGAVVNACCRIPRGLKLVPIPELPRLHYHLFRMREAMPHPEATRLAKLLHQHANDWSHA